MYFGFLVELSKSRSCQCTSKLSFSSNDSRLNKRGPTMDVITGEFRDLGSCTAMSVNKPGNLAFIAGRRAFGLINLDKPQVCGRRYSRILALLTAEVVTISVEFLRSRVRNPLNSPRSEYGTALWQRTANSWRAI